MTARDVIAEMRAMRLAADPEMLRVWAARLESTLAQPSGEAVAWAVTDPVGIERPFTVDNADKAAHYAARVAVQEKQRGNPA